MTEAPLVSATGIRVSFAGRPVLRDVSVTVAAGEVVTLIGPNGAGKTTLLRVLLGLVRPDGGRVARRPGLTVGFVPQRLELDPTLPLTVRRFLGLAGAPRGAVEAALRQAGIERLAEAPVQAVSGGELQRVKLARALLRAPRLLVLDEAAQGLDVSGQLEFYRLVETVRDRLGCGVLMVSHDLHLVMAATDRVLCLNGHLCCEGHPDAVSRHPEYLALFGPSLARGLAVYRHHHDHDHRPDAPGDVEDTRAAAAEEEHHG